MEIQWPLLIFSVLLGVASGTFVFMAIGELTGKFKQVRSLGAIIALACVVVGGIASVFHLGHPERATHLLGNLSSGLTKEIFVVGIMVIVAAIYAVTTRKNYPGAAKAFGVIGGIVGLALPFIAGASYMMAARPTWDSLTLPLMYLGSGLGLGMLLMAGLVALKGDKAETSFAVKLALVGVVLAIVTSVAYIAWIAMAPYQVPSRSIDRLISGDLAAAFWVGVVVIGLVAPIVLAALSLKKDGSSAAGTLFAAFACTAVGAIALRVIMYLLATSVQSYIYH